VVIIFVYLYSFNRKPLSLELYIMYFCLKELLYESCCFLVAKTTNSIHKINTSITFILDSRLIYLMYIFVIKLYPNVEKILSVCAPQEESF